NRQLLGAGSRCRVVDGQARGEVPTELQQPLDATQLGPGWSIGSALALALETIHRLVTGGMFGGELPLRADLGRVRCVGRVDAVRQPVVRPLRVLTEVPQGGNRRRQLRTVPVEV